MKYWSILQEETNECYFCHSQRDLHWHHVYHWCSWVRRVSEEEGCMVRLCSNCHEFAPYAIHGHDHALESELQHDCQMAWEIRNHKNHDDFIKRFGKGYVLNV